MANKYTKNPPETFLYLRRSRAEALKDYTSHRSVTTCHQRSNNTDSIWDSNNYSRHLLQRLFSNYYLCELLFKCGKGFYGLCKIYIINRFNSNCLPSLPLSSFVFVINRRHNDDNHHH